MELTEPSKQRHAGPNRGSEAFASRAISRRAFLQCSAALLAASAVHFPIRLEAARRATEARYWERTGNGGVRCLLCPKGCRPGDGQRGDCRVRENRGGTYYALAYGLPCALHIDPIEKKPFFHVLPGTEALSLATVGCNLRCKFCQNWQISQSAPEDVDVEPVAAKDIVAQALSLAAPSIAYTYGEPVVFIEYMEDIASLARASSLRNVVVSNGYIQRAPLLDLTALVDAIKIDLKAFDDSYYRDVCGGSLAPVLDTITTIHERKVWLELVYLIVPTLNDDPARIREMARWIMANLGPDVPLHFSRFFPNYQLTNLSPTPVSTLDRSYDICREAGLRYVYVGNVPGHRAENTYCPRCSKTVVARSGYRLVALDVMNGKCRFCGQPIPGIWQEA